ncbi:thioredoxin-like domain-containing protein [Elizabethkingia sp. JS20170427COW]|uniref:TlpA family protein disulfide reductase n=1 Tax=Elizabethkingia sp. JS20170427COW TaxID=2583851 RepID=UPI0011102814|nr:thioredoxin-like domain-containing protein [Elizabethkingia sp. JS20170427COW]QCX53988.1 TlpA family protein disulfide reductase [Elizabethkingia sp. JS20170427COW]
MKKILLVFTCSAFLSGFAQQTPKVLKTSFSKEALSQKVEDVNGKTISIGDILKQNRGKVLLLDLWAGWCRDCVEAMPKLEELEKNNPKIDFIFLSLDRNKESFLKNIEKYNKKEKKNYWFSEGWKNKFNNYIDLNWIPRYLIIDQQSNIAHYYAISPDDPEIQKTINQLLKK